MSFTYAPKTSQTSRSTSQRGRGRGAANSRGRGRGATAGTVINKGRSQPIVPSAGTQSTSSKDQGNRLGNMDPSMDDDVPVAGNSHASTNQTAATADRMQRRDAFTMISPNEKKRQQIAAQAQRETEAYQQYKQSKKMERVSYVGTVGGGEVTSEANSRRRLEQDQRHAKYNRLMKTQQYKAEQKQREEFENQQKKDLARKKAIENKEKDKDRNGRWQEEHRRTNEAFLARLEREQKMKRYKIKDVAPAAPEHQKPNNSPANLPAATSQATDPTDQLVAMFPNFDRLTLEDILQQCNGSLEDAISLING